MTARANCTSAEVERLNHHMPTIAETASNTFARGSAKSITKQARRKNWRPSVKQLPLMRELVTDLFRHTGGDDDIQLIE